MREQKIASRLFHFIELFGIITTLALLPIDRFPYLHVIPFKLGLISLVCLVIAAAVRLYQLFKQGGTELKRLLLVGIVLLLPLTAYAVSTTYAISNAPARSATYLFALGVARAFAFCVLLTANVGLRRTTEKTLYIVTALVVTFGLFQFFFDVFGAHAYITDLRSCCTSNSTYVFPRVHSTSLEPLYFDHFLMIPIWLLTFRFFRSKHSRKDRWLQLLFVATATLFILTIARSATIGLIIAGLFFVFAIRKAVDFKGYLKFMTKQWGMAVILTAILILISGIAAQFIDKKAQYGAHGGYKSISLFGSHAVDFNDGSSQTRYNLWPKAIGYVEENPLVGVGAGNSRIKLNLPAYQKGKPLSKLQPFNNDSIAYIVELGLFGVVMLLPLILLVILTMRRELKSGLTHWAAPFIFVLIGMAVQSNFFQSILLTRTWIAIGMVLLIYVSPLTTKKQSKVKS